MTDLELTKLAAEAIGIDLNDGYLYEDSEGSVRSYNPLHDDAQALALVKKFNIGWDKEEGSDWHVALRCGQSMFVAHNADLNRAIVECVAKVSEKRSV